VRLHAYVAQALLPGKEQFKFAQLPGVKPGEKGEGAESIEDFVGALAGKGDGRVTFMERALESWGRLELVDASFKGRFWLLFVVFGLFMRDWIVIDERLVTPSSIVLLVVKLRLSPPWHAVQSPPAKDVEETKRILKINDEKDNQFLVSKKDAEDESSTDTANGWAHAPYWPGVCHSSSLIL